MVPTTVGSLLVILCTGVQLAPIMAYLFTYNGLAKGHDRPTGKRAGGRRAICKGVETIGLE